MSGWYYARTVNGQEEAVGPYDDAAIQNMISSGVLPPETLVYHPTYFPEWTPVSRALTVRQSSIPQHAIVTVNTNPPAVQDFRPRMVTHRRHHAPAVHPTLDPGMIIAIIGCVVVVVIAGKIALDEYRLMRAKQEIKTVYDSQEIKKLSTSLNR